MTVKKLKRDPEAIEPLSLYAALSPFGEDDVGLRDAARIGEFLRRIEGAVRDSTEVASRMHGLRTQALFRAVLVALGEFTLLTDEDVGEPYVDGSLGDVRPPDFRVIDRYGQQLLVEVKNVAPDRPMAPHRLREADVAALLRYGELMGVQVAVAHYWSAWNRWTLVGLDRLSRRGDKYEIDLSTALKHDLLGRFGDRAVGTRSPLTLTLRGASRGDTAGDVGEVELEIEDVQLSSAGVPITSEHERALAWFLLRFGTWELAEPRVVNETDRAYRVEISASPPEEARAAVENQGFAIIGTLSSMYSMLFNAATLDDDGGVRELRLEPEPGHLADLIPDDYWDRPGRALEIWRLEVTPS